MHYQTYSPPEELRPFVKYFWALSSDIDTPVTTLSAFPDGCPGVIMVQSESALCDDHKKKLPEIYLHGQITKPSNLTYAGKISAIGISFQPHALKSVFGIDANELTSTGVDLTLIQPKRSIHLPGQLQDEATVEGRIKMLSDFLLYEQQRTAQTDETVKYAIEQIVQSKGNLPLKDLQQKLQLSARTLERKFNQAIGISPKLFSRICSFQESLQQMRAGNYDKLSDVAYEQEYFDQSHFIRAFKEFTGFSPLEFKKTIQQEKK